MTHIKLRVSCHRRHRRLPLFVFRAPSTNRPASQPTMFKRFSLHIRFLFVSLTLVSSIHSHTHTQRQTDRHKHPDTHAKRTIKFDWIKYCTPLCLFLNRFLSFFYSRKLSAHHCFWMCFFCSTLLCSARHDTTTAITKNRRENGLLSRWSTVLMRTRKWSHLHFFVFESIFISFDSILIRHYFPIVCALLIVPSIAT